MKPKLIIAAAGATVVILAGFFASSRSAQKNSAPLTESQAEPSSAEAQHHPETETRPTERVNKTKPKASDKQVAKRKQKKDRQAEQLSRDIGILTKAITKANKGKSDKKISLLAKRLNMNPEQIKALEAYYEKKEKLITDYQPSDDDKSASEESLEELANSITESNLVEYMAEHLSDNQKDQLDLYVTEQKQNKADKAAFKQLGEIIGVTELTDEQRQQAYDILSANIVDNEVALSNKQIVSNHLLSSIGMSSSNGAMGTIAETLQDLSKLDTKGLSSDEISKQVKALRADRMETKVQMLSSVLDEGQLDAYRSHLNADSPMLEMAIEAAVGNAAHGDNASDSNGSVKFRL